jgi:hypothetical protein
MRSLASAVLALVLACPVAAATTASSPRSFAPHEPTALTTSSPLDAAWSNRFGLPIPNGAIRAIASFGGQTVVAGDFTQAGPARAHHVAAWDGTTWHPLGDGLPWSVEALAVYGGQLIAAGSKPPIVPTGPSVYAWNGTTWTALGSSDATVHALAVFGGELYAGGDFNSMNGVSATRVARWNGTLWQAAGSGITGTGTRSVRSLAVYGTQLVAGGFFASFQSIAAWDGSTWTGLGPGLQLSTGTATVSGLVAAGTDLVAAGSFNKAGATVVNNVARWNGVAWSNIGNAQVQQAVGQWLGAPLAGAVISGSVRPARWNGTAWVSDGSPPFIPFAFFNDGSAALAGGSPSSLSGGFARFDGSTWTGLQSPWAPGMSGLPNTVFGLQSFNGSLYEAGSNSFVGADDHWVSTGGVVRWDGNGWTSTPPLAPVAWSLATFGGSLVAGINAGVYRLDPGTWTRLGGTIGGTVYGMAQHGTDLVAVGDFEQVGISPAEGIARWDGTSWSALGSGFDIPSGNNPETVVSYGGEIVVGGYLTFSGAAPIHHLVHWTGSAFADLGGGADGEVYTLAVSGPDLLVGGPFTHVGGVEAHGAARWNGSQWSPLGDNAVEVSGFREHGGRLFATGEFLDADGNEAYGAAVWTGERWYPLGSGVDGYASSLDFLGDDLYVGGTFGWAFGKPSFNIASLPGVSIVGVGDGPRTTALALDIARNPSRGPVELSGWLPAAGHMRLAVHDVSGRQVAVLADESRGAGPFRITWQAAARPGVYFATLEIAGLRKTIRIARLD